MSTASNSTKRNKSILSFFQKTDDPPQATSRQPRITQFAAASGRGGSRNASGNVSRGAASLKQNGSISGAGAGATTEGLFLQDPRGAKIGTEAGTPRGSRSPTPDEIWDEEDTGKEEGEKYNENRSSVKRRKTGESTESLFEGDWGNTTGNNGPEPGHAKAKAKYSGPFIDESDSEDDLDAFQEVDHTPEITEDNEEPPSNNNDGHEIQERAPDIPSLVRQDTSYIEDDEYANFDDLDEEGMREEFIGSLSPAGNECEEETVCPICQSNLGRLSEMVFLA